MIFRRRTPADFLRHMEWRERFRIEAPVLYYITALAIAVAVVAFGSWLIDALDWIARGR
jgi:hypothetical protein